MKPSTRFSKFVADRGFSTQTLAASVGASVPAVKAWRAGTRKPSWGFVVLLAEALGVRPRDIVSLIDSE